MSKFKKELQYKLDDMEPHISKETMDYHYNKHYVGYCTNLEKLIINTDYEDMDLDDIVDHAAPGPMNGRATNSVNPIYNNAAQIRNHEFFFDQLSSTATTCRDGELLNMINNEYGSFDNMITQYKNKVTGFFGAGWIWLTLEQHKQWDAPSIKITSSRDGNTFINHKSDEHFIGPLCVIDIWEHAYYIDHRNDRSEYFDNIIKLIDWTAVEAKFINHQSKLFDYTKPWEL